jgi:hypothetical protein
MNLIVSTTYLPPVSFFAHIVRASQVYIEAHEHFVKQSYRTRTSIATAQGKMDLIIPVIRPHGSKTMIKDVLISYDENWQKTHWHAIESAYNTSPFFEFYREYFYDFYTKKYRYVWDWNHDILQVLFQILSINTKIIETDEFIHTYDSQSIDIRYSLSPKVSLDIKHPSYIQVFDDVNGFIPQLSIFDVLCNLGPETSLYIKKMAQQI